MSSFLVNLTYSQADICFHPSTLIHTDQGICPIKYINPNIHTIFSQKIEYLTQTKNGKELIHIPKNAFSNGIPTADVMISQNHKIYYNGKFMEAYKIYNLYNDSVYKFLTEKPITNKITKIKYDGLIFNILMKHHGIMNVSGLLCETLDPSHYVAKIYENQYNKQYNQNMVAKTT
jgi:hypothetical protein